ncbi:MAG: DUF4198 domain-containing protein [Acidobacteriota bacterium]|nr:DUF4198 domain-containing protein [Acidobacteriota bacterium]
MKRLLLAFVSCAGLLTAAHAHDLFLKFDGYFLKPNSTSIARLFSGTFRFSENAVARDRFVDASLVKPDGSRAPINADDWRDEANKATLKLQTGEAGTYVAGITLKPREITLKAAKFNAYLREDGIPDILAARRRDKELGRGSHERYSKHVKALFQVGDARTNNFNIKLGHPVEIIPQQNPYSLKIGDTLEVLCLKDGQPLANQFVMAGRESGNQIVNASDARSDSNGIGHIKLNGGGKWFIKFIHMAKLNEPGFDYESKWASLTFAIRP